MKNKNLMKINEWGVFVDDDKDRTFEIRLPDDLACEVAKFLTTQATEENVVGMRKPNATLDECDTNGKIEW